jgi:hypothetical protein
VPAGSGGFVRIRRMCAPNWFAVQPSETAIVELGIRLLLHQAEPVEAGLARGALDERMQHQIGEPLRKDVADRAGHSLEALSLLGNGRVDHSVE